MAFESLTVPSALEEISNWLAYLHLNNGVKIQIEWGEIIIVRYFDYIRWIKKKETRNVND